MSQYKDQITGNIVFDMRCISNHIMDFAKENYPKSNMVASSSLHPNEPNYTEPIVYRIDSDKRLFNHPSMYCANYGLSTIPDNPIRIDNIDFTIAGWVYPITIGSRYGELCDINHTTSTDSYLEFIYSYDRDSNDKGNICLNLQQNYYDNTKVKTTTNRWNHLALTKQGDIIRIYLDGNKIWEKSYTFSTLYINEDITFVAVKEEKAYFGELTVILNQALWTGGSFEVPNTFLTGEKEFESKYVIYTAPMNGWPNITGTVVCDFRANKKYIYDTCCNKGRACNIDTYTPNIGLGTVTPVYDKYNNFEYSYELYKNTWIGINDNASTIKDSRNNLLDTWTACQWVKIQGAPTIPYAITGVGPTGCHALCVRFTNGNQLNYYLIGYHPDNNNKNYLSYYSYEFGEIFESTTFQSIVGQWQFITWVKTSSKIYLFRNGVLLKSANVSKTYSGVIAGIGANVYSVMDPKMRIRYNNLVVINGQALWTDNFTPPTGYLDEPKITKAMILKRNNNDSDINLY